MSGESKIEFGIAAPQIHVKYPLDLKAAQAYIQRAEALGYHSLWVQEQMTIRNGAGALEGVSLLSYIAALTEKVRLGMAVFLITLRNPIQLAKSIASLDQLSQGRLIAGVGLGAGTGIYPVYGLDAERRVARFLESLTLMKKLWSEEPTDFNGQFWQVSRANLLPKPMQKPHPPIWFGGNAPAALKRTVKHGNGFIGAGSTSTADFQNQVPVINEALAEAKIDRATFQVAKRVYLAVDSDRERAGKRLREWFGLYYGKAEMADKVAVWGNADDCVEQLSAIKNAGARLLVFNPVFDMTDHLELLASEIIPKLR